MKITGDDQDGSPSSLAKSAPAPCQRKQAQQSEICYPTQHVIRALMAVAVIASHCSEPRYAMLIPQKQLPVDLFFSVEGFLAGSLAFSFDNSFGRWTPVIRRFTAIYPLYLMGLLAGLLVMYPLALRFQDGWSVHIFGAAAVRGLFLFLSFFLAFVGVVFFFFFLCWVLALVSFVAMVLMLGLIVHWHDINLGWQAPGYWGGFPRVVFGFLSGALLFRIMQFTGPILPRLNPLLIFLVASAILFLKVHLIGLPLLLVVVPLLTWTGAISTEPKWLPGLGRQAGRRAGAGCLRAGPAGRA